MSDEFNATAREADDAGFDPSEMSEDVAAEARAKEDRSEPLGRPEEYADEDAGDPLEEKPERPPPPPPRTYKVKANGKEAEVAADSVDAAVQAFKAAGLDVAPEDLLRGTQMLAAGQERLREAAAKEKEAQLIKQAIREGAQGGVSKETRRALKAFGVNEKELQEFAIKQVHELMEIERLERENPAELERRKTQEELDAVKAEKERTEAEVYQARAEEKLSTEIRTVLESNKLPKDPYFVKRLASHMLDHLDRGVEADDLHVQDFVPLVLEEMQLEHATFLGRLSGEELLTRFPGMAEKVRKAYAARVRREGPPKNQPEAREEREPEDDPRRLPQRHTRMSANEVLRRFRSGG